MKRNPTFLDRTNLVGEWLLDGNANDTGGSNNGTATNVTYVAADRGYVSEVGSFNGTSSRVTVPDNTGFDHAGAFFVEARVKFDIVTANQTIVYRGDTSDQSLYYLNMETSDDKFTWVVFIGGSFIQIRSDNAVSANVWYHIVGRRNSSNLLEMFVNGVKQAGSGTISGTTNPTGTPSYTIGADRVPGNYMDGNIGLVRDYDRDITDEEVFQHYLEGLRRLGPTNQLFNNTDFSKYSLPNLRDGLVLDTSRAAVSGTYHDQSGNGNSSSSVTAVTDTSNGLNNVMGFNGSTSVINYGGTIIPSGAKSISLWLKTSTSGTNKYIIGNCTVSGAANGIFAYIDTGNKLNFFVVNGGTLLSLATSISVTDGVLRHIVFTWDGTTSANGAKIYINGVEDSSTTASAGSETTPDRNLSIGLNTGGTAFAFPGDIINPNVYGKYLTEQEIKQLYYSNFIS